MRRIFLSAILCAVFLACSQPIGTDVALSRVRQKPSGLPGLSVEQAVERVLADMSERYSVKRGRWYSNPAIEHSRDSYKVGFEFEQEGRTARFGWTYHASGDRLEPLTPYARQISPDP